MDIIEQCLGSVDKKFRYNNTVPPINFNDFIECINKNITKSSTFVELLENSKNKKILLILDQKTDYKLIHAILNVIEDKIDSIDNLNIILASYATNKIVKDSYKNILADCYNKYEKNLVEYDPEDTTDFDFFGTTSNKQPILIHKLFLKSELAITVSEIYPDLIYGYKGSRSLVFQGIAPKKSFIKTASLMLDDDINDSKKLFKKNYYAGSKENLIIADAIAGTLIARSEIEYYSINYIKNAENEITDIFAGDIFLSQIEMTNKLDKFSFSNSEANDIECHKSALIKLEKNNKSFEKCAQYLYSILSKIEKGCRVIIDATEIDEFGSEKFITYLNINTVIEQKEKLLEGFDYNLLNALIIKYLSSMYHIAIISNFDKDIVSRSGMNNLDIDDVKEFIEDKKRTLGVTCVERFSI